MEKPNPPLKWHGGKHYLAAKIVAFMPAHVHYVEPYAGGLSVLLAKDPEGVSEVVNDLNAELTNFWRVLRDEDSFAAFARTLQATPFSEREFQDAMYAFGSMHTSDAYVRAAWFFTVCRQSLAGRMKAFAPLSRRRTRRGMNEQASAWLSAVEGLPAVHERLKRVVVLEGDALRVIRGQDDVGTLFYLDPPYLHETRASPDVYAHEMTRDDHAELLDVVKRCRGKVMLSGYPSELYDTALQGWTRHAFDMPNNSAGGETKARATEVLWCNF